MTPLCWLSDAGYAGHSSSVQWHSPRRAARPCVRRTMEDAAAICTPPLHDRRGHAASLSAVRSGLPRHERRRLPPSFSRLIRAAPWAASSSASCRRRGTRRLRSSTRSAAGSSSRSSRGWSTEVPTSRGSRSTRTSGKFASGRAPPRHGHHRQRRDDRRQAPPGRRRPPGPSRRRRRGTPAPPKPAGPRRWWYENADECAASRSEALHIVNQNASNLTRSAGASAWRGGRQTYTVFFPRATHHRKARPGAPSPKRARCKRIVSGIPLTRNRGPIGARRTPRTRDEARRLRRTYPSGAVGLSVMICASSGRQSSQNAFGHWRSGRAARPPPRRPQPAAVLRARPRRADVVDAGARHVHHHRAPVTAEERAAVAAQLAVAQCSKWTPATCRPTARPASAPARRRRRRARARRRRRRRRGASRRFRSA